MRPVARSLVELHEIAVDSLIQGDACGKRVDTSFDSTAFVAADTSFVELQGIAADSLIQQDGVAGGPRKAWGSVDSPTAGS